TGKIENVVLVSKRQNTLIDFNGHCDSILAATQQLDRYLFAAKNPLNILLHTAGLHGSAKVRDTKAQELLGCVSGHLSSRAVCGDDATNPVALGIENHDGVTGCIEQSLVAQFALAQSFLYALTLGDILRHSDKRNSLPIFVANRRSRKLD